MRNLITEFTKAFIYLNRHLLYTEMAQDNTLIRTYRDVRKSQISVKHLSESQRVEIEKANLDHSRDLFLDSD